MPPDKIFWKVNTMHTTKKNVTFSKPYTLTLPSSRYPGGDKMHLPPQFKKYFIHPWISSTYPLRLN